MVTTPSIRAHMFTQLKNFTCGGNHVSALAKCIDNGGVVCSDMGTCLNGSCACVSGREGIYCENVSSVSSGSDATIIATGESAHWPPEPLTRQPAASCWWFWSWSSELTCFDP